MFRKLRYNLKKKKYQSHFGEDNIIIDNIILNPVHLLPEGEWLENQQIDFWMDDHSDFYLLSLCNSKKCSVILGDDSLNQYIYIIMHMPVDDTIRTLEKVIHELKKIPYYQKFLPNQQICFYPSSGKE